MENYYIPNFIYRPNFVPGKKKKSVTEFKNQIGVVSNIL